ncbi:MAG: endonuclease III domain-containing protein [Planctomycetota bacterium]
MDRTRRLTDLYARMLRALGPQHWWPGKTPFEIMVGAVLTQNTAWRNVEQAILNLKRARRLSPRGILSLTDARLARLIRPSGYFNVKAGRLKSLVRWYVDACGGQIRVLRSRPLERVRAELLAVRGVGPETADSILLYAAGRPTFVVDAYTRRVLARLGFLSSPRLPYETVRAFFMEALPRDAALYNEFHALFVALGKDFCRPRPRCDECPLDALCRWERRTVPAG